MRKAISILVILCLLAACLPLSAGAANPVYDLWVGGQRITGDNLATATYAYNPDSGILDLWDAYITGDPEVMNGAAIYAEGDLIIGVTGENTLIAKGDPQFCSAIHVKGDLSFRSSGSLDVSTSGAANNFGIWASGDVTFADCTVEVRTAQAAASSVAVGSDDGNVTVKSGSVLAVAGDAPEISRAFFAYNGSIVIEGGTAVGSAGGQAFSTAPDVKSYAGARITASKSKNGDAAGEYLPALIGEYKYLRVSPSPAFTDVPAGAYYVKAVALAVEHGVTNGTGASTFSPNNSCTRAQAVTFLWNAAGKPAPTAANPFTDVKPGAYYYSAVLWAVEHNITSGTGKTTFSPDAPCTRGQIVTFLWNKEGKPAVSAANPFADVRTGNYYYQPVLWAVGKGVTNGTSAAAFSPDAVCTRGQIVTFLWNSEGKPE